MSEDYYDILGIGKDADPESIRKAYRREAKRSHPDASGSPNSSERFRRVEEAYETLGDVRRREAYDRSQDPVQDSAPGSASSDFSSPFPRQPLRERPSVSPGSGTFAHSSFGYASGSDPVLEVLLSVQEAGRGVTLPLSLPVSVTCPECAGGEFWNRMFCFTCGGAGLIRRNRRLVLRIPPGLQNGGEFRIDTREPSLGSIRVRLIVE